MIGGMQWLALIALDGLVVVLLIMLLMRVMTRWGWNELRDGLLAVRTNPGATRARRFRA